jgi:hypothetical protein
MESLEFVDCLWFIGLIGLGFRFTQNKSILNRLCALPYPFSVSSSTHLDAPGVHSLAVGRVLNTGFDFGVGSSWLRGHPQGPESNSGGWLPATSDVIAQVSRALGSFLSGTLASYGASTVARTSDRGHVAEA